MHDTNPIHSENSPLLFPIGSTSNVNNGRNAFESLSVTDESSSNSSVTELPVKNKTGPGNEHECCDNTLPSLMEGMAEEFRDITESVLDEVHKADEDSNYMIEMGLTRNLSLLHDDVVDASGVLQLGTLVEGKDTHDVETGTPSFTNALPNKRVPFSAYFLLGSAIVGMSTIGPLLQLQDDTTATMKVLWRMIGTSFLLAPMALADFWNQGKVPKITLPQWVTFLLSTFFFVVMQIGFCLSLDYTSIGNAVILSNSVALILLIGKVCIGAPVTLLEITGAVIAFGGATLCSKDSAASADSGVDGMSTTFIGDLLALISAIGGVGYVTFAKTCRTHMSLGIFMFLTMSVGSVMVLLFQVMILREHVTWDSDVYHGIGGFLHWDRFDRLPLELMVVIICNLAGTMGYVRAMPHFDSLVICSVQLLEPVIAEFLSYFAGVGDLPGLLGWIGNAGVALGTFVVLYESQTTKDPNVDHNKSGQSAMDHI